MLRTSPSKWESKSHCCSFLGYSPGLKAYGQNRISNTVRGDITPREIVYKSEPILKHLREFISRGLWESKSHCCSFLGYSPGLKAYGVWDEEDIHLNTFRPTQLNEREPFRYITMPRSDSTPVEFVDTPMIL
ncbi:hypothetical protein CCR75_001467 [Bremia lactucae]|uniref:Uncharacterized protein n=1 Tax=Bremia lactucae TaxID=4779 RepID=A0A976IM36_BRELC|nr:hypothetical protein CCR75_001467 [Bremia lactucae]